MKQYITRTALVFVVTVCALRAEDGKFPIVSDDLEVSLFAMEPLVRNPCAIVFDAKGRLCVGMGPQYRSPKPDTPGDSVWILTDEDGDGRADARKEFATGFNSIQGLAWKGRDLWVANAPDLTVVRDIDGDDEADEYVRVFTDLGNLEHGLHGLNVGPDGKIYMSKGNSKGLTDPPSRVAPKPFRDLWGVEAPDAPDFPEPLVFAKGKYEKNYHSPSDDWGMSGGVLRCDDGGKNLEIISRGFRNPWDISMDDQFNWLGTDNDQTMGDKIFAPFFGADFGWGHAWSYDWKGDDHLPTVPSSGPLFEGSGTGVVFLNSPVFPEKYRGVWLVNDWLRRETSVFRPKWDGALLVPDRKKLEIFAHAGGGRAMGESKGRAYDPTDIEVGPDGAVYVASWGRVYGARYEDGKLANEGRIYRLMPRGGKALQWKTAKRAKPIAEWVAADLLNDLDSELPVWRTNAQEELIRRGVSKLSIGPHGLTVPSKMSQRMETWMIWTFGRMQNSTELLEKSARNGGTLNERIQAIRVLAHRAKRDGKTMLPAGMESLLSDPEPRIRHAAILAAHEAGERRWNEKLLELAAGETDRLVYYSSWQALRVLMPADQRKSLMGHHQPAVRRAMLLGLFQDDALSEDEIRLLPADSDAVNAALIKRRLGGKAETPIRGRPLKPGSAVAGSDNDGGGTIRKPSRTPAVNPVAKVTSSTGSTYRVAVLEPGVYAYSDRSYRVRKVPDLLNGEAFVQAANDDADASEGVTVALTLRYPATLYLADDARAEALPKWARDNGWEPAGMTIETDDPAEMRVYRKSVPAGELKLGTNRDGVRARKGNYLVIAVPKLLALPAKPTIAADVLPLVKEADADRGRDLFLSRHGAACSLCHRLDGVGNVFAPDLSDIASRMQADILVRSILDPSADITEGFASRIITMKNGDTHAGVAVEETGRVVKLATVTGSVVTLDPKEIAGRETTAQSLMPATFAAMLNPQQVADVTAYLLTKKAAPKAAEAAAEFSVRKKKDSLDIHLGGQRVATYLWSHPVLTRPALVNVRTPSGMQVTRSLGGDDPDDKDHLFMHPGIAFGFGDLDGNDYWRLRAKVVHDGFAGEPRVKNGAVVFTARNLWRSADDKETVCVQTVFYSMRAAPNGIWLDVDSNFRNDRRGFYFGDQEESGLCVRVATPLRVQGGSGRILNNRGEENGKGTWGKEFEWIDYSGVIDGNRAGIMIVPHPDNARKSWAHSRDYGVVVANPFPKQPREQREPYVKTEVKKGEDFRLRYSVFIHEGEFDPATAARSILK